MVVWRVGGIVATLHRLLISISFHSASFPLYCLLMCLLYNHDHVAFSNLYQCVCVGSLAEAVVWCVKIELEIQSSLQRTDSCRYLYLLHGMTPAVSLGQGSSRSRPHVQGVSGLMGAEKESGSGLCGISR